MPDLAGLKSALKKALGLVAASTEAVGTTDTQTITNKTISGSSNTISNVPDSALTSNIPVKNATNTFTAKQIVNLDAAETIRTVRPNSTVGVGCGQAYALYDASSVETVYAQLLARIVDNSDPNADGQLSFYTLTNDSLTEKMVLTEAGILQVGSNLRVRLSETGLTAARIFTFPDATTTMVGHDTTQTLTNKTLTTPIISSISNSGTITVPTGTDTLVGKATTDILTNKTISGASNTISAVPDGALSANVPLINAANDFSTEQEITKDTADLVKLHRSNAGVVGTGIAFNIGTSGGGVEYAKIYGWAVTASPQVGRISFYIANSGAPSERVNFAASGNITMAALATLSTTGLSALRTFTFPDATTKLVGDDATQTLTNKTLTTPTISGHKYTDLAKTTAYTLLTTDSIIRADASAGGFTLTLPAASGNAGLTYTIIRTDVANSTNLVTIDANASELINGNLTHVLYPAESVVIECTGTAWECIVQPEPAPTGYYFEKGATANNRYLAGMSNHTVALLVSTTGPVVNTLYAMPFIVARTTKFDLISAEVTTLGSGSNLRLGIYADTGNCYPGVLLFDSGNISSASTGVKDSTITAGIQIFNPGLYWLTYENSATVPQIRALPASGYLGLFPGTLGAGIPGYAYTVAHTVGALPNPYTGSATKRTAVSAVGSPIPAVGLRPV